MYCRFRQIAWFTVFQKDGGWVWQRVGKLFLIEIKANTDYAACNLIAVPMVGDKDACDFFSINVNVIGPFDLWLQPDILSQVVCQGQRNPFRHPELCFNRQMRINQDAHQQVFASFTVPAVRLPSTSGRLKVGHDNQSVRTIRRFGTVLTLQHLFQISVG